MSRYKTNYRMALGLALISLAAAAPMYLSMASAPLAVMLGCPKPSDSFVIQCVVLGVDWGMTLTSMLLIGFMMGVTLLVGALVSFPWLLLWLALRASSSRPQAGDAPLTDAGRARLWMAGMLAGVTTLANLPWYLMFGISYLFKPAYGTALAAIREKVGGVGSILAPVAGATVIGWVLLALVLWLSRPRGSMKTGKTSLWMLRAFAAINLVAAFPALIWLIALAATADGACKIYGTPAECLILGVNWAPALVAITSLTSAILRAALTALVMLGVIALALRKPGGGGAASQEVAGDARSWLTLALAGISILVSFPSYWTSIVGLVAQMLGCQPFGKCIISGSDWSATLEAIYMMAARIRIVVTIGFLALLVWGIVAVVFWKRRNPVTNIAS